MAFKKAECNAFSLSAFIHSDRRTHTYLPLLLTSELNSQLRDSWTFFAKTEQQQQEHRLQKDKGQKKDLLEHEHPRAFLSTFFLQIFMVCLTKRNVI